MSIHFPIFIHIIYFFCVKIESFIARPGLHHLKIQAVLVVSCRQSQNGGAIPHVMFKIKDLFYSETLSTSTHVRRDGQLMTSCAVIQLTAAGLL